MASLKFTAWNNDDPDNKAPRQAILSDPADIAGIEDEGDYRRILISRNGGTHSLKVRETLAEIEKAIGKK